MLFNLREVKEASHAFSFVLNKLNIYYKLINSELDINYKLINNKLSINNISFEYITILAFRLSTCNKLRAL